MMRLIPVSKLRVETNSNADGLTPLVILLILLRNERKVTVCTLRYQQ